MKCCSECKIEKSDDDFTKNNPKCRNCTKEYARQWRDRNREYIREQGRLRHKKTYIKTKIEYKEQIPYKDFPDEKKKLMGERVRLRHNSNLPRYLWSLARSRSKTKQMEFNIEIEDIIIPEYCPILGLKLEKNEGSIKDNSISLDRIDSSKGYIKGNIQVISYLANAMKQNADITTLHKFAIWVLSLVTNE